MNRRTIFPGIILFIAGLLCLPGCGKDATRPSVRALNETASDFPYQASFTELSSALLFADGDLLLTEENGERKICEDSEPAETAEDDVIACSRQQGGRYVLHEQDGSAFLQTPSAARIALPSDPRGYDPNRIRAQFLFGERTQYLRYGYQLYLLNGETITAVAPDIRWVGGGSIGEALYAVGYETEQKQTEGSGMAALYQLDQTQATRLWTLPHGASIVCGGEDCLYLLADDTLCEYRDDQLLRLTQLLPLGIVSNEITGMTVAADGLRLLTQTGYHVLTEREASDTALPDAPPQNAALRVGYCNDETGTIQAVLAEFAAENPEITVTAETYASHDELLIKLISGDVPDVLWFHGELATLQSLAGKGLLRDLSGIAAELNQFDEYYGNLLACGTLGDALCVLFPAFSVEVFSVPDAILPESRKIETCRQFDDVFSPFCPDGYGWTTREIVLNWFLNDSLSDFVNYDTMEANFQQQSFYEMLEFCKRFPAEFEAATTDQPFRTVSLRSPAGIVSEEEHYARFSSFDAGVTLSPLPFSDYEGFGVNADSYLAVTQSCRNEALAKQLLQFIFCADTQEKLAQQEYGKLVLHKKTNETIWKDADDSEEWARACESLREILQRADHLNGCTDDAVRTIIEEECGAYFAEDASAQDVAARIDRRVALYLMEQES